AGDALLAPRVTSRAADDVRVFGWTPFEFIRRGLLSFVFSDARDRNQISFVIDHVRAEMLRHAVPSSHHPGAVIMRSQRLPHRPADVDRSAEELSRAGEENANGDPEILTFNDLVHFLSRQIVGDDQTQPNPQWSSPNIAQGTNEAFVRRLHAMSRRIGHLIDHQARTPDLDRTVNVIDINSLHDDAQRFVVGAVLDGIWQEKQGAGREPLRFIVLDELNKYAPRDGHSPIKEILVDIAARGRSLGVILIGCQQNATRVDSAIVDNASIKIVGRLDASHADEYKFLSAELRQRATRFLPGTMVLDQPVVPAPIPVVFPFPPYATNVSEDAVGAGDIGGADPLDALA
ncbi:MAG: ATP-binding protein, partial [Thermoanaerobaculia bacterium]